ADARVNLCDSDEQAPMPGRGTNLSAALAAGGRITFDCPVVPARIVITKDHSILRSVSLDGGDASRVILDRNGRPGTLFSISAPGSAITLANISIVKATTYLTVGAQRSKPSIALASHPGDRIALEAVVIDQTSNAFEVDAGAFLVSNSSRFSGVEGVAIKSL